MEDEKWLIYAETHVGSRTIHAVAAMRLLSVAVFISPKRDLDVTWWSRWVAIIVGGSPGAGWFL